MAFYNIYSRNKDCKEIFSNNTKGNKKFKIVDTVCIKQGFSFIYSIFYINAIYSLIKKRYRVALVMFLISFLSDRAYIALSEPLMSNTFQTLGILTRFLVIFLSGVFGNSITESYLLSKGAVWLGSYYGRNEDEALSNFYSFLSKRDGLID